MRVTFDAPRTQVAVIGAGQAGLSVGYYLQRLGLTPGTDFVILDRGPGAGGAWQHRWEALRIGSAHRINDLPAMAELDLSFETADRTAPAREVVADYYARYEQHFGLEVQRPVAVRRVENRGIELVVTYERLDVAPPEAARSGLLRALGFGRGIQAPEPDAAREVVVDAVVNATGTWGAPFVPWYPGMDTFRGRHVHTADYVSADEFAGQNVVVVGGGTSAIGFLLELEGVASSLTWCSRRAIEFLEEGQLNLEAGVAAVAMQDEAARAGRALPSIVSGTGVPKTRRIAAGIARGVLVAKPVFAAVEPDGVRFADGTFQPADAIIWSTGFRPELRHLAPLRLREKSGGVQVGNGSAWKDGRIFFAGYGPQASTIGANRAGRTIARQVVAHLSNL